MPAAARIVAILAITMSLGMTAFVPGCSSDEGAKSDAADAGSSGATPSSLPQTCVRGARKTDVPTTCNGDAALCPRTYDRVTVPMTHNAMSNVAESWSPPNQSHGIARQLADGVRGMMLDLHYYDVEANENTAGRIEGRTAVDQVYLCHGPCALGRLRLLDGLCTITKFLDDNPGEIFSIVFENDVTDGDTDEVLRASGFGDYVYTHPKGAPWPTLREMIDTNKRLVLFVENNGGTPAYLHRAYTDEMWDTPYAFQKKEDFNCSVLRGQKSNALFLVNHWLGRPFADIALAREVNTTAVLGDRVAKCTAEAGRVPTFVSVDFYDVGDLLGVVRKTNGI
jgi:hypothetical protein